MSFGKFLKEKRMEKGLSLRQMSYKTGFSHSYISDIEKEVSTKIDTIEKIIEVLELTEDEREYVLKEVEYARTPKNVLEELKALKKIHKGNSEVLCVGSEMVEIPVYGDISAGNGHIMYGDVVDTYLVSPDTKNIEELIALRVSGDSMENKIPDKSQVLIRMGVEIENGTVGAFCIGEECFVKTLKVYGGTHVLRSINSSYEDIEVKDTDDYYQIGKVIEYKVKM